MAIKALMSAALLPLSFCHPQPVTTAPPAEILCKLGRPPIETDDHFSAAHGRWVVTVLKTGQGLCSWQRPGQ